MAANIRLPLPDWADFYIGLAHDEYDPSPTTKVSENSDVYDWWLDFLADLETVREDETDAESDAYVTAVGLFLDNPNEATLSACTRIVSVPNMIDIAIEGEKNRLLLLAKISKKHGLQTRA